MHGSPILTLNALKFDLDSGSKSQVNVEIAVEETFNLYVNGELFVEAHLTPLLLKEWAVGFLHFKGLINSKEDLKRIILHGNNIAVSTTSPVKISEHFLTNSAVDSSCISALHLNSKRIISIREAAEKIKSNNILIYRGFVKEISKALNQTSKIFRKTGGTHSAALFDSNERLLLHVEDIGRHNAVDKIIGSCILSGIETDNKILAVSGRLTEALVFKCVRAHIPILISISAPLSRGIQLAKMAGITLIGFARGPKFTVYTYPHRIK